MNPWFELLKQPCRGAFIALAGFAVATSVSAPALASESTYGIESRLAGATAILPKRDNDWNFNVGVSAGSAPTYMGDKQYDTTALPLIDIDWRGRVFLSTQRGLGAVVFRASSFRLGTRLTFDRGRDSADSTFIQRLPDIDPSFEGGLLFENISDSWRLTGDVRKGLQSKGHNGIIGSLGVARSGRISERANVIAGVNVTAVDTKYVDAYFGVPTGIAGLPFYSPQGGIRDVGAHVNFVYLITDQIYFTIDLTLNALLGDSGKSPIVREDLPFYFGTTVGVRF